MSWFDGLTMTPYTLRMDLLDGYDSGNLTVASLGGHSALDVCHGAKYYGLNTIVLAKKGREKTYERYYRTRKSVMVSSSNHDTLRRAQGDTIGCVDDVVIVNEFKDVLREEVQEQLRAKNTIFVHSRYFWVYFENFAKVEQEFHIPLFGSRSLLKLEERNQPFNQYHLLQNAGIRTPKVFDTSSDIDRLCIVKANEVKRAYERAFFFVHSPEEWEEVGSVLEAQGKIATSWRKAPIEEFVLGAPVNFNFFYSPLSQELELLGTDTRRQTNLDGVLRLPARDQEHALKTMPLTMVETGHIACTVKESLLEKAFDIGERFVKATQNLPNKIDPLGKGIIGPFSLQGAVVAEDGQEDIVIFDVSFRIPGSPGISATPYSGYLYGHSMSMGERIGMELRRAVEEGRVEEVVT